MATRNKNNEQSITLKSNVSEGINEFAPWASGLPDCLHASLVSPLKLPGCLLKEHPNFQYINKPQASYFQWSVMECV